MSKEVIQECFEKLLKLQESIKTFGESKYDSTLSEEANLSLVNMYHYLKSRSIDSTQLQNQLIKLGLSSMGRSHPHLLYSIHQMISILAKLQNIDYPHLENSLDYTQAYKILHKNLSIFGHYPASEDHTYHTKIMITLPSEAAKSEELIASFFHSGAELFRINTAHDTPEAWHKMAKRIQNLDTTEKPKIYVDLAGPKIRTERLYRCNKNHKKTTKLKVFVGDRIRISHNLKETLAHYDTIEKSEAIIECSNIEALGYVNVDEKVFIDDGKIALMVYARSKDSLLCEVTRAKEEGSSIRPEKGINFPDSKIKLNAITQEDRIAMEHIINYADIIGISFCQDRKDIEALRAILESFGRSDIGIVAKIETKKAVENLPEILHALIAHGNSGVMLARGDLAIEVGFENLSLIQEEILNLCEAAHMPIIYATQVLENMMKTDLPSRAEITDAAVAQRADCIMLNKGTYAENVIKTLRVILKSMHTLFRKNRQMLRAETIFRF